MTTRTIRRLAAAVVIMSAPFVLSACGGGKKQQAEIDRLNERLEELTQQLQESRKEYAELDEANDELRDSVREEKSKARKIEAKLASTERELQRAEERAARDKERAAAAAAAKKRPGSRELREATKTDVTAKLDATVKIKGDQSSGAGFLVKSDEKVWIYCAASILAGNKKLEVLQQDGTPLTKFGAFELATDADLARLELQDPPEQTLDLAEPVELKSGASLLSVSDVGTLEEGRSYQPEPTQIKADSKIGRCPAGAPVFHGDTGVLLGMVGQELNAKRDLWREATTSSNRQGVVYRLDRKVTWQAMPIGSFLAEGRAIAEADRLTRLVYAFAVLSPGTEGINLDASAGSGYSARKVFEENSSESVVRSLLEFEKWLESKKGRASETDVKKRINSVFGQMARASGARTREFEAKTFSPFNEATAKQSLEWRKEAQQKLGDTIKRIDQ